MNSIQKGKVKNLKLCKSRFQVHVRGNKLKVKVFVKGAEMEPMS